MIKKNDLKNRPPHDIFLFFFSLFLAYFFTAFMVNVFGVLEDIPLKIFDIFGYPLFEDDFNFFTYFAFFYLASLLSVITMLYQIWLTYRKKRTMSRWLMYSLVFLPILIIPLVLYFPTFLGYLIMVSTIRFG